MIRNWIAALAVGMVATSASSDEVGKNAVETDCGDRAAVAVQKRYEGVRDISARFEQRTRSALSGEDEVSTGRVVLAKPGRMRWSYEAPEPSLVVSDGETLWLYDPAFGEAQKLPAGDGFLSGAAAQFLLGAGDMRRDFELSVVSCAESAAELELIPREPAAYEKLYLGVNPNTGDVHSTRIRDLIGNLSSVTFHDLEANTSPSAETFEFRPPEGVGVIELTR